MHACVCVRPVCTMQLRDPLQQFIILIRWHLNALQVVTSSAVFLCTVVSQLRLRCVWAEQRNSREWTRQPATQTGQSIVHARLLVCLALYVCSKRNYSSTKPNLAQLATCKFILRIGFEVNSWCHKIRQAMRYNFQTDSHISFTNLACSYRYRSLASPFKVTCSASATFICCNAVNNFLPTIKNQQHFLLASWNVSS